MFERDYNRRDYVAIVEIIRKIFVSLRMHIYVVKKMLNYSLRTVTIIYNIKISFSIVLLVRSWTPLVSTEEISPSTVFKWHKWD